MHAAPKPQRCLGQHANDLYELPQVRHPIPPTPIGPTEKQEAPSLFLTELSLMVRSRLEWTVAQWSSFLETKGQVQQWMESVEQELGTTLPQQPGLKEKSALLERLRAIQADVDAHTAALSRLADKAVEMHDKTGDQTFGPESRAELNAHFADISAVVKVICLSQNVVTHADPL